jgi:hypothetical protein
MSIGRYEVIFDPDAIAATPFAQVGELFSYMNPTYGYQIYRYCQYNGAMATLLQGLGTTYLVTSSFVVAEGVANTPKANTGGVCQRAAGIPDLFYGFLLVWGRGLVVTDAAVLVDTPALLTTATGLGRFDDTAVATLEHCILGQFKEAAVAAAALVACEIRILG